eukprot:11070850-Alexandrium_andersonii.AAC.1
MPPLLKKFAKSLKPADQSEAVDGDAQAAMEVEQPAQRELHAAKLAQAASLLSEVPGMEDLHGA